jgi:ATP-dependent DNA helicase DinG
VGEALRDSFFDKKRSVVLTSATFAVRDSLSHMSKKLGLREEAFEGRILETPFDLPEQVQAWVHSRLPDPNQPDFVPQMSEGIVQLASELKRKMLVLFTSLDMLRRVADAVEPDLAARGIRLHAQGMRQSRKQIRNDFLADGPAVLLGAASFWEGVDFPGEELEVLVLARLPFLVPSDPLVRARAERIEAEGGDSFSSYYLPEAILRFRQGFGRLIRRREDRGLFVVCDSRLSQRSYGRQYQKSVGVPFRAAKNWDEIVDGGTAWFGSGD